MNEEQGQQVIHTQMSTVQAFSKVDIGAGGWIFCLHGPFYFFHKGE